MAGRGPWRRRRGAWRRRRRARAKALLRGAATLALPSRATTAGRRARLRSRAWRCAGRWATGAGAGLALDDLGTRGRLAGRRTPGRRRCTAEGLALRRALGDRRAHRAAALDHLGRGRRAQQGDYAGRAAAPRGEPGAPAGPGRPAGRRRARSQPGGRGARAGRPRRGPRRCTGRAWRPAARPGDNAGDRRGPGAGWPLRRPARGPRTAGPPRALGAAGRGPARGHRRALGRPRARADHGAGPGRRAAPGWADGGRRGAWTEARGHAAGAGRRVRPGGRPRTPPDARADSAGRSTGTVAAGVRPPGRRPIDRRRAARLRCGPEGAEGRGGVGGTASTAAGPAGGHGHLPVHRPGGQHRACSRPTRPPTATPCAGTTPCSGGRWRPTGGWCSRRWGTRSTPPSPAPPTPWPRPWPGSWPCRRRTGASWGRAPSGRGWGCTRGRWSARGPTTSGRRCTAAPG